MGRGFYDAAEAVRSLYREANEALGFDLAKLSFEGPEGELGLTANTQPAILTASVAAATMLAERGVKPAMVAGHSLGEYSALVVAGALSFSDAVRIVRRRGEFMQEAVPVETGAMAAVMGVELAQVEEICGEAARDEVLAVANINSPVQVVIAGHRGAVERAVALANQRGAKQSVMLPVSAPFHSPLMLPAADRLAAALARVSVQAPKIPVVRNVDGGVTTSAESIIPFLVKQVASPVRWTECVGRMAREGADTFLEVGPGRVLTALLKRISKEARGYSVEDPESLEKALAAMGKH
jgi:[acyl-carrier-protein] S-malonyltransferase